MEPRPFSQFLRDIRRGALDDELSHHLSALVTRVEVVNKPGSVVLELTVSPNGDGAVTIKDKVKVKEPAYQQPSTHFFVDSNKSLIRQDPRQLDFTQLKTAQRNDISESEVKSV